METIQDTIQSRVILVAADTGGYDAERSLDELSELCRTAGHEPVARVVQRRQSPDPATYVGKGILEDVAAIIAGEGEHAPPPCSKRYPVHPKICRTSP